MFKKNAKFQCQYCLFLFLFNKIMSECVNDRRNQSSIQISDFSATKQSNEEKELKYLTDFW